MAGTVGRPKRDVEIEVVFLRLPKDVVARVTRCTGMLEMQEGVRLSRTEAVSRILTAGCEALETALEGRTTPGAAQIPLAEISTISNGVHHADSDDMPAFVDEEDEEEQREPIPAIQDTTPEPARQTPPAPRVKQARRAATTAPMRPRGLPREKLQEIADERTRCEGLSLREFAQRLHDRGIYSSMAKDGSKVPANQGNVKKWLVQAREAGVL